MFNKWVRFILIFGIIALMVTLGTQIQNKPALARTLDDGYQLTLTSSGTTFNYGSDTPSFTATLTFPQGSAPSKYFLLFISVGNHSDEGTYSLSGNTLTENMMGIPGLAPGQYTAVATFDIEATQTTIQSNSIVITGLKEHSTYFCSVSNLAQVYTPGQNLIIAMELDSNQTIDWQDATFTLKFTGPSTLTYTDLGANSNNQVTVKAPTVAGNYQLLCTFNGTPFFYSEQDIAPPIVVSQKEHTGTIRLYTNPTTYQPNQVMTYYIVVPAAPGFPTPTGQVNIGIGTYSSRGIQLSASGTALVQETNPLITTKTIQITYQGDKTYNAESATFPATNPPISGQGGSNSTPTPTSAHTPTPAGTETVTPTATVFATTTPSTSTTSTSRPSVSSSVNGWLWLMLIAGLIAIGGIVIGILYLRGRTLKP